MGKEKGSIRKVFSHGLLGYMMWDMEWMPSIGTDDSRRHPFLFLFPALHPTLFDSMRSKRKALGSKKILVLVVILASFLVVLVCGLASVLLEEMTRVTPEGEARSQPLEEQGQARENRKVSEKVTCHKKDDRYRCRTDLVDLNATCNLLHQTKLTSNSEPLVIGTSMRVISVEECCLACRKMYSDAEPGVTCNSFSFCPLPSCWHYDGPAQYGECWLYHQEDPRHPAIELIGTFSSRFRNEYSGVPAMTQWMSGIVRAGPAERDGDKPVLDATTRVA